MQFFKVYIPRPINMLKLYIFSLVHKRIVCLKFVPRVVLETMKGLSSDFRILIKIQKWKDCDDKMTSCLLYNSAVLQI